MHRDIKPDNFLIGAGESAHIIYIIDFGLAKYYCNPKDGIHIPYKDKKNLTGTARYASLSTHYGIEQSRRDDLECLGYIMVYFMKGSLPWQGLQAKDRKEKYEKIKIRKASIPIDKLCEGIASEFAVYLKYCRGIKFEEAPNYTYLKKLLENRFNTEKYTIDYQFDWMATKSMKKKSDNEAIKLMLKDITDQNNDHEEKNKSLSNKIEEHATANKVLVKNMPIQLLKDHTAPKHKIGFAKFNILQTFE